MRVEWFSGGYMLYAPDIALFEWEVSRSSLNAWNPAHMVPDGYLFDAFRRLRMYLRHAKARFLPFHSGPDASRKHGLSLRRFPVDSRTQSNL